MQREFTGYVRYAKAYDTSSMDIHQPEGWVVTNRDSVIIPPPESLRYNHVPVRWVSGYPEAGSWEEWWTNPERYTRDASDRVFGSAAIA
ncbi:hypothetical protein [Synechococcus elongatus]|uniref:hypothetical protein n=1 Tax=Synechococcus elongatus TaxID=32046 RepID=UPI000F7DAD78|nr:hypothetical protein [Synechococcus elongatus]